MGKRRAPDQLQDNTYNKLTTTPSALPESKEDFLSKLSGINPTYSSEYSPAPVAPEASASQRIDLGTDSFNSRLGNGLNPEENIDQLYYMNQGAGEQIAKGVGRLAGSTVLKAAQGISSIGSLLIGGVADAGIALGNATSDDKPSDYISFNDIMNNPITQGLNKVEDALKDQLKIYKPVDYDNKNFLQQLATTSWWADEGADAFAFALSNFIPAGILGKLGLGAKLATGLGAAVDLAEDTGNLVNTGKGLFGAASRLGDSVAGKMGKFGDFANEILLAKSGLSNPVQFAKNVDLLTQNAFMTSSEALSEAQDTGRTIQRNYLQNKYKDETNGLDDNQLDNFVKTLSPDEQKELKDKKAEGMKSTFWANVAALSLSNHIEAGLVNKIFGENGGVEISHLINPGEGFAGAASRVERKGLERFFMDTKLGTVLRNIPKYSITEGLYEENIQDAIQKISTQNNSTGKLDYIGDVLEQSVNNLGDKQSWKAIGAGMLIGSLMGGHGALREKSEQDEAVGHAINQINKSRENFLDLKNTLYQKNEDGSVKIDDEGRPVYDIDAITDYAANSNQVKDLQDLHDGFKNINHDQTAKLLKDELFTKYALAHLEAGLGDELQAKVKALQSYKDEDLAQMGLDPIEIKNGHKVSTAQRAGDLMEKTNQITNDYNQITKTIPQTDANNARINEAAKAISRVRSLNEVINDLRKENIHTEAQEGGPTDAHTFNKLSVALDARQEALDKARQNDSLSEGTSKVMQSQINKERETLGSLAKTFDENHSELQYGLDSNNLLTIDGNHSPDAKQKYENIRKQEQAKIAKEQQLNEYNKLTDFNNGESYFNNKIAYQKFTQIQDRNNTDTANQQAEGFKEGDVVQYGDEENPQTSQVNRDENGILNVNGNELNSNFITSNPNIRKLTEPEVNTYNRNKETTQKVNDINSRLDDAKSRKDNLDKASISNPLKIEDIVVKDGIARVSEKDLNKQLRDIDNSINTLSQEESNSPLVDRLNNISDVLFNLWNKAFPNTPRNLDNNQYQASKTEVNLTKEEQSKLENALSDLLEVKKEIDSQTNSVNDEISQHETELNKVLVGTIKPEETETNENPVTTVMPGPMPDISETGLFKTAGSHLKNGELTDSYSQKSYYKFVEELDPRNPENYSLRTVTINDDIYGKGKEQDIFREEPEQYQNIDNIKVLVVDKNGKPVEKNGTKLYTSLPEITDSKTEPSHFSNFRVTNAELAKQQIENYRAIAEEIKKSSKPFVLQITGKSNGKIVTGPLINAKEAFGENPPLKIITDNLTTVNGKDYPLPKGLVYVNYNGQPIGAQNRTLTPLESKAVLNKLKEYAKLRGNSEAINNGELLNQIKGIVFLGERKTNPQLSIFFAKGQDRLVFGDSSISTKDLVEGKYDTQLEQFLNNQNHQVDASLLNANEGYKDINDKSWNSYSDYLLNGDNAPLTFAIQPKSDDINKPQFYNSYLTFSAPKQTEKIPSPQVEVSQQQASTLDTGTNFQFTSLSSLTTESIPIIQQIEENTIPTEEIPESTNSKPQDDLLDDLFLNRDAITSYSPINFEEEENWFKKNISNSIPFNKIKGLIDGKAYGKFLASGQVLISDVATEGTAYHEAFHVVSQLYLTDKERNGLYDQWRKDNTGEHTNTQVEEALAEEFREYMLTKESPYKSWFQKIVDFVKGLIGIDNDNKDVLFDRINSGYFKNANIVNKSDLNLYSMNKEFSSSTTKDLMDSLTLTFVRGMFKNNFSLNDITKFNNGALNIEDKTRFSNLYDSVFATVVKQMQNAAKIQDNGEYITNEVIPYIENNKRSVQEDHIKYLSKFGINLQTDSEVSPLENHEMVKDSLGIINTIEFSSKSGMPNVIKLMIASLPELSVNRDGKRVPSLNNLGLPKLSDYKRNTAILQNELSGIGSFREQIYKVQQLANRIPEFSLLLDQLGVTPNTVTPVNLSGDYFDLQSKWRQQFDKAYYTFYLQLYDGNNNRLIDSNTDKLTNTIRARWQGDALQNRSAYKIVNGQYILNGKYFDRTYNKSLKGEEKINSVLNFYKDLGITFSRPELVDIDVLSDKMKALMKKIDSNDISSIFDSSAESKGFINEILGQEIATSFDYSYNQHINPEGKTVYNISLHNYLSKLASEINDKGLPDELTWDEDTKDGNPLVRNSQWAKKFNEGKKIKVTILEGARINEQGEQGSSTADLTYADAASQQFTSVLNGIFPFMRAGDKSLEHGFTFGENVKYMTLDEATNYFSGALSDEMLSSYMLNVEGIGSQFPQYANNAKDLRVFKEIFNDSLTKEYTDIINNENLTREEAIEQIDEFSKSDGAKAALQEWSDNYVDENLKVLEDNNLVVKNNDNTYSLIGISSELANKFIGKETSLSESQMKSLVEQFTFNQLTSNIEQGKIFTGDFAFYKDFFKRTSGLTGTGKTTWMGDDVNDWLNENRKRFYIDSKGERKIDKQSDGIINSVVFKDIKTISSNHQSYIDSLVENGIDRSYAEDILNPYGKTYEEGDAQGYVTLPEYREFLIRTGDWTPSHEVIFPRLTNGEKISKKELGDFMSGYPVLKPQYFGKQTGEKLFVPTFYKFSVMPLIPSVVKGTELENLMHTMHENGIGMSLFASGNKVGGKEGNSLYNEEGKIDLDGKNLTQQKLDYTNLKVQLDISPKTKEKVIIGTQVRKLVLANLADKIITINGKQIEGNKIIKSYSDLINKSVELETSRLVDKLGLEQKDENTFVLKNPQYLRDLLMNEAFSRQAPDNLLEGIKQVLPEEGDIKQFDVLVNRNKIENILMALVNNNVIKQKTFGDMRVQGASTGFESKAGLKGRSFADAKTATWFSKIEDVDGENKALQFYKADKNGTQPMEVYLPHYFKELIGKDININELDSRLLNIVGYRTPTQGLNSIELMKVKGFLPQEAGNLIVVPSEIVVKAGSDFDIDKLSLFFPNYEMKDDKPSYLEYKGNEENLPAIHNRMQDLMWKIVSAPENFAQLITPNSTGDVEKIANEVKKLKPSEKSKTDNGLGNSIGWKKNLDIRSAYLLGKAGVGVTALHNVHHVLSQIVKLKSNPNIKIWLNHNESEGSIDFSKEREVGANAKNSSTILENLSAFLNGFVDIAKNPFLKDINANTDTAGVYFYLLRAGVPLRQAIMFMNQPIITDYLNEVAANNSMALKVTDLKVGEEAILERVLDKYQISQKNLDLSIPSVADSYKQQITTSKLESYINGKADNRIVQRQILIDYLSYKDAAQDLSDLIKATTPDTRGTGATMNTAQENIDNYQKALNKDTFENVDKFMSETFVGSFYNAVKKSVKMYAPMFFTENQESKQNVSTIKQILDLNRSADKEKVLNNVKNDIVNFALQTSPSDKQKLMNVAKILYTGDDSVAKDLQKAKNSKKLKDNILIKALFPLISANATDQIGTSQDLDNIKMFSKKVDAVDSNLITDGWKELFETNPKLAKKLVVFTILQSGLNNSPVSFTDFIPNEYYVPLANKLLGNNTNLDGFSDKFIRNNYQNDDLVPRTKKFIQTRNGTVTVADGNIATIAAPRISKITNKPLSRDLRVYPYIKTWNGRESKYELYRNTGEMTPTNAVKFERVSTLGDGYNLKEWTDESMILSNRKPAANTYSNLNTIGQQSSEMQQIKEDFRDDNNKPLC